MENYFFAETEVKKKYSFVIKELFFKYFLLKLSTIFYHNFCFRIFEIVIHKLYNEVFHINI